MKLYIANKLIALGWWIRNDKHWGLKFNHGVEIGARLAYLGHYKVTGNKKILAIANEELKHREFLEKTLRTRLSNTNKSIDMMFTIIGTMIQKLCYISPKWSLNLIARVLEMVAVISYTKLATKYPDIEQKLLQMANNEAEHERYFKTL